MYYLFFDAKRIAIVLTVVVIVVVAVFFGRDLWKYVGSMVDQDQSGLGDGPQEPLTDAWLLSEQQEIMEALYQSEGTMQTEDEEMAILDSLPNDTVAQSVTEEEQAEIMLRLESN